MNDRLIQQLWDRYRDDELSDEQRLIFEEHLRTNPSARELWDRESRWLAALADDPSPGEEIDPAFTDYVIARWSRGERRAPVGRIIPWAAAAVLMLAASLVWMMNVPPDQGLDAPPVAEQPPADEPTDPLSVLVLDMSQQVEQQPDQLEEAIQRTASLFNPQRLADMLDRLDSEPDSDPLRLRSRG